MRPRKKNIFPQKNHLSLVQLKSVRWLQLVSSAERQRSIRVVPILKFPIGYRLVTQSPGIGWFCHPAMSWILHISLNLSFASKITEPTGSSLVLGKQKSLSRFENIFIHTVIYMIKLFLWKYIIKNLMTENDIVNKSDTVNVFSEPQPPYHL